MYVLLILRNKLLKYLEHYYINMSALVGFYNKFTRELAIVTALSSTGFVTGYMLTDSHHLEKKRLINDYETKLSQLESSNKTLKMENVGLQKLVMDLTYNRQK